MFPLMLTTTFIYLCKEPKIKSYCTTNVCFLLLVNMFCYYTCSHLLYFYGENHFVCLMPIKYLYCIVLYYLCALKLPQCNKFANKSIDN